MSTTLSETTDALQLDFGEERLIVSLSAVALASGVGGRFVPTPDDIENAIAVVEDAIMLALGEAMTKPAFSATLAADAETFTRYADALGASIAGATVIPIETVENAFNQLADIANGAPSGRSPLPLDALSVARLVLLRELMHHLGFRELHAT